MPSGSPERRLVPPSVYRPRRVQVQSVSHWLVLFPLTDVAWETR